MKWVFVSTVTNSALTSQYGLFTQRVLGLLGDANETQVLNNSHKFLMS